MFVLFASLVVCFIFKKEEKETNNTQQHKRNKQYKIPSPLHTY